MKELLPDGHARRMLPPPAWLLACAFVAFAGLYVFHYRHDLLYQWMEDLHVYARAVRFFRGGTNPYYMVMFEGLRFVYPPIVLYVASGVAAVMPGESEWALVGFIHLTCVLLAPFVLARYYLRAYWFTPVLATLVFLAESRFTGMQALYSANVAPSLYLAALLAAVPGMRKNRWAWFYVVILLAGAVKITFVFMLLLPLLAGRRQWLQSIATGAGVGAIYAAQSRLVPALYLGYKWALLQQVKVEHQYGYGVFGVVGSLDEKLHRPLGLEAYALHGLVAAVVLALLFWLRSRGADVREPSVWMGLLVMTVMIVNPRMLHYDAYLALIAAYFVLAVVLAWDRWRLIALLFLLYVPCLVVPYVIHSKLMHGSYELLIILVAIAAGIRRLFQAVNQPATEVLL
jgi:hypothetical protein